MSSPWIILFTAGLFEVGWAIMLKSTHGFTRLVPSALTLLMLAMSLFLLAKATETLPIGTAYGVWVGIGAAGTAVLGIVLFGESASAARLVFIALLLVAIAGLKLTSP